MYAYDGPIEPRIVNRIMAGEMKSRQSSISFESVSACAVGMHVLLKRSQTAHSDSRVRHVLLHLGVQVAVWCGVVLARTMTRRHCEPLVDADASPLTDAAMTITRPTSGRQMRCIRINDGTNTNGVEH